MTSSDGTLPRSRAFTWVAGLAALATIGLLGFLVWKVSELEGEFGAIRDDRARIEAALAADRSELDQLADRRDLLRKEIAELGGEVRIARAARTELDGLEIAVEEARKKLSELRADQQAIQDNLATRERVEADLSSTREALLKDETRRDALLSEIKEIEDRRARAEQSATTAERTRDDLVSERDRLSADRDQLQAEVNRLERERRQLEGVEQDLRTARATLGQSQAEAGAAETRRTRAEEQHAALLAGIQAAQADRDAITAEIGTVTKRRAALAEEVVTLVTRRDELQTSVAVLEGRLREADGLQGKLDTIRQLMKQADTERQRLRGEIAAEQEQLDEVREARIVTEARIAERQAKLEALEQALLQAESRRADAVVQLRRIEADADTARERKEALLIEIRALAAERAAEQQAFEEARVARASIEGRTAQRATELASLQDRIVEEAKRIKDLQVQVAGLGADLSVLEERRNDVEAKRVAAREDLARSERDLAATRVEAAEARAAVERLERRSPELLRQITDFETQRDTLEEVVREMERTAAESLEALEQALLQAESRRADAVVQLRRIEADADTARERKEALLIEIRALAAERAAEQQAFEEARVARASIEGRTAQRATELASLQDRIVEEAKRIKDLQVQVAGLGADLSVLEERRNDVEAKRVAAREDLARSERDLAATRVEAAEARAAVERLERRSPELLRQITDFETQRDTLEEVVREMERTAAESRVMLEMLEQQIRKKRETLDSIEDQRAQPNAPSPAAETKPSSSPDADGADASTAGSPPTSEGSSD